MVGGRLTDSPKGGVYGPPSKRHLGVCAIFSETIANEGPHAEKPISKSFQGPNVKLGRI